VRVLSIPTVGQFLNGNYQSSNVTQEAFGENKNETGSKIVQVGDIEITSSQRISKQIGSYSAVPNRILVNLR
jgi:hypothetical protein